MWEDSIGGSSCEKVERKLRKPGRAIKPPREPDPDPECREGGLRVGGTCAVQGSFGRAFESASELSGASQDGPALVSHSVIGWEQPTSSVASSQA